MGAYTELVDFTFTAAETSRTFSGLSITKNDFVKVVTSINNTTGTNNSYGILANNSVITNYHNQKLFGTGSTVGAGRSNNSEIDFVLNNIESTTIGYIKLSENDRYNHLSTNNISNSSSIHAHFNYTTSSGATFTSGISSLTFTSSATNGIGTGSRIQIYRLDAQKVADITVTSNTTQVDISNLSIDKDSEYLLTWTIESSVTAFVNHNLTPNDLTTLTGYQRQEIAAGGSGTGAGRANNARIAETSTTRPFSTGYAHIKLSNIGAYTVQAYDLLGSGTNEPVLANGFISSTAENITSITKLNVIANSTNAIKAGSRFTLYKLYE